MNDKIEYYRSQLDEGKISLVEYLKLVDRVEDNQYVSSDLDLINPLEDDDDDE